MSLDGVTVDAVFFQPIRVSEETLEGLVKTAAPALFPGYEYFDFRPPIRCGASTRHPDGVLVARGSTSWWVVEVETHLHSVSEHIEPQLRDLSTGFYGPDAFRYLNRHRRFDAAAYPVDTFEPQFLLLIDSLTAEIRDAATRTGFHAIECCPFRSEENRYALAVTGHRPRRDIARAGPGLDVVLRDESGMAALFPLGGGRLPSLATTDVIVSDVVYAGSLLRNRRGVVLPMTPHELQDLCAGAERFRLTTSGQLVAILEETSTVLVEE